MIASLLARLFGRAGSAGEAAALRAELERLRAQSENMRRAMRQCIDCEYRVEAMARRARRGLNADGSAPDGRGPDAAGD